VIAIPPLVHVTSVEVIGDHELRLSFEDGTVGDVSFGGDEWTGVFEPYVTLRDSRRCKSKEGRSSGPTTASTWRLSHCMPTRSVAR
jgi:hypothetical protein